MNDSLLSLIYSWNRFQWLTKFYNFLLTFILYLCCNSNSHLNSSLSLFWFPILIYLLFLIWATGNIWRKFISLTLICWYALRQKIINLSALFQFLPELKRQRKTLRSRKANTLSSDARPLETLHLTFTGLKR